jgi:N-acetylglutamate synthase-like GNAT family acetyltransferase
MPYTIRPASEADRAAILGLMRPRDYNRIHLKPECFMVAEEAGRVIGIGQIKRHGEGTPELASLVVAADRRGTGVGSAIVRSLVAHHSGLLYLFCLVALEGYYAQFGFRRARPAELPLLLAGILGLGNLLGRLPQLVGRRRMQVIAMQRLCPSDI